MTGGGRQVDIIATQAQMFWPHSDSDSGGVGEAFPFRIVTSTLN